MNNSTSIREQLTFKAWLQVIVLVGSLLLTFLYTLPKMEEISLQVEASNAAVENYQNLYNNGIPFNNLVSVLNSMGQNNELIELVTTSGENVAKIIQKTTNEPYLDWVVNSLNSSDQDRALLMASRARINSIIPTLSPVTGNIDENSITLREYVTFIEKNILKQFSVNSLAPLGIEGVKYREDEQEKVLISEDVNSVASIVKKNAIGEFVLRIDFEDTTNKNISNLLNYIHELGEPSILSESGVLTLPVQIMSNPLIVIDSLSLENPLNLDLPNAFNKWSISLKFYVRGSSLTDKDYLIDTFNKRKQELSDKIVSRIEKCSKDSSCVELERLQAVEKKFTQFSNSMANTLSSANLNSVESVYLVGQQIQSLKSISQEFENIK